MIPLPLTALTGPRSSLYFDDAYAASGAQEPLEDYLAKKVFAGAASETLAPTEDGMAGFDRYTANFKEAIHA